MKDLSSLKQYSSFSLNFYYPLYCEAVTLLSDKDLIIVNLINKDSKFESSVEYVAVELYSIDIASLKDILHLYTKRISKTFSFSGSCLIPINPMNNFSEVFFTAFIANKGLEKYEIPVMIMKNNSYHVLLSINNISQKISLERWKKNVNTFEVIRDSIQIITCSDNF